MLVKSGGSTRDFSKGPLPSFLDVPVAHGRRRMNFDDTPTNWVSICEFRPSAIWVAILLHETEDILYGRFDILNPGLLRLLVHFKISSIKGLLILVQEGLLYRICCVLSNLFQRMIDCKKFVTVISFNDIHRRQHQFVDTVSIDEVFVYTGILWENFVPLHIL